MRVTRATVPYYFWAATLAAAVLASLVTAKLLDMRSPYADSPWTGLPAVSIILICALTVVGRASKLLAVPPDEPDFKVAARRARVGQLIFAVVGIGALVGEAFVASRSLSSALTIFFCLSFYLQYLGYFALVRRYG